jgi:hypothetical protein
VTAAHGRPSGHPPAAPRARQQPLSADDRRSLRQAGHLGRLGDHLKVATGAVLVLGAGALAWAALPAPGPAGPERLLAAAVAAGTALAGAALLYPALWRQHRLWRPMAQALRHQPKQVLQGRLQSVRAHAAGHLFYTLDGRTLDLVPLAGALEPQPLQPGQALGGLAHLPAGTELTLHWLPLAAHAGLLLQAHYASETPAERSLAPIDAAQRHALRTQLMQLLALAGGVAVLMGAFALWAGPGPVRLAALLLGAAVLALGGLGGWRQWAQRRLRHQLVGTVSERFDEQTEDGTRTWYRVGGELLCPGPNLPAAQVGERVQAVWLVPAQGRAPAQLSAFGPVQTH